MRSETGGRIRAEAFLAGAFITTVLVWSAAAVLTLIGIVIGGGTLPPETLFMAGAFIYDFATLPVVAALLVAAVAVALLRARRYSMRHRYTMIWIFTTAYVVVSALLAYLRALLEGAGSAAPLAAAVFLSWGAMIAYGYAAFVAAALAIAEKLSIVSSAP
jgi:hypothetical protein